MSARIKPHKVRGRHLEEVREKDPHGRIVIHHRAVDTLGKMLRSGTISQAMHDAAKEFEAAFIVANLDALRALPILRVPGRGRNPDLNDHQLHARRRVHRALLALGGQRQPRRLLCLARARLRAVGAGVGAAARVGRSPGAAGAGAGHAGGGVGPAGGALWGAVRPSGPPEGCLCDLADRFRIEEQKSDEAAERPPLVTRSGSHSPGRFAQDYSRGG